MSTVNKQITGAGSTVKFKTTSGGSYAVLISVTDFDPGSLKAGTIKLKRPLQDAAGARWRKKRPGDPEAGQIKINCIWNHFEYALVRGWLDVSTYPLYFQLILADQTTTTGSTWERIGFVVDVEEPKVATNDEGVEEMVWSFTIEIDGEPTFTEGD